MIGITFTLISVYLSVSNTLKQKIAFIKGVGESRAQVLADELGVYTIEDLINIFPFRYDDRSAYVLIKDVRHGDSVQLKGILVQLDKVKGKSRNRLRGVFKDASGLIELTWFQGAKWMLDILKVDHEYVLYGKVNIYGGRKSIAHPEMELASAIQSQQTYLPVYASTEALNRKNLGVRSRRNILTTIFQMLRPEDIEENLPERIVSRLNLCRRYDAYQWIHFPRDEQDRSQASNRLKFEELFFLQLRILQTKKMRDLKLKGFTFDKVGKYFNKYYSEKLSFELTAAQKRVIKEIRADLGSGRQMNRLLQGDVGSGKTVVALMSMLISLDNGYQACLLAPTEILAQQHFQTIYEATRGLGVHVAFLSGSVKGRLRKDLLRMLKDGYIHILIGTHAILEDPVVFQKLGLAVTDEQHRFGVAQRAKLWIKNDDKPPHILVMTATPIPRTLAMTTYGDLDVSVIDELPPGRKSIKTLHKTEADRMRLIKFMKEEIAISRQVYVVYPLIEESEALDLADLNRGYEELLQYFPRPDYQIAVVHGRMKAKDKDMEMQRFVSGKAQIMVATTVIEVGVNVPNASVMIIENAARFGLSQLHQLRGRVGRGADQSYCILVTKTGLSQYARERIKTMCRTNNGFEIAEADMKLRGPGDLEGTQQSGVMDLKIASITGDTKIMQTARYLAQDILEADPELSAPEHQATAEQLRALIKRNKQWGRIS